LVLINEMLTAKEISPVDIGLDTHSIANILTDLIEYFLTLSKKPNIVNYLHLTLNVRGRT